VEFLPFELTYRALGQIGTVYYFAYFILMPFWTPREKCKPVPARVRMDH
jgi:ubiquinol-cytochrome c reductase cytochrome b subunit